MIVRRKDLKNTSQWQPRLTLYYKQRKYNDCENDVFLGRIYTILVLSFFTLLSSCFKTASSRLVFLPKFTLIFFRWIHLNLKGDDDHGQMSPSRYYEKRQACGDANCCGATILPLGTPQAPKQSLSRVGLYEELRVVNNLVQDPLLLKCLFS